MVTEPLTSDAARFVELAHEASAEIRRHLGHALAIREVDAGSCNGCEIEISGLTGPVYDSERFGLEHAWRLLKDQLKWLGQFTKNCSKRTKNFAFGAYSLSSNPGTSVEDERKERIILSDEGNTQRL